MRVAPALLLFLASAAHAQSGGPAQSRNAGLTVAVEQPGLQPALNLGSALDDPALRDAVRSGLPLRLRFTVELWRDEIFDNLVDRTRWTLVLQYEPLSGVYRLLDPRTDSVTSFASYEEASSALTRPRAPPMAPGDPGRYYYLATLEIGTLSLSDLDELEDWLRGELQPAVTGGGSVSGAIGRGLKRLLIRVLDLPVRRFLARSGKFELR
ncbi:MAG TPA: DUF4390 domain-containing protein [Longimicrobiales bacterium]|nr:DUF4390 domain-containing protein [Longimicrobiales bacterium]